MSTFEKRAREEKKAEKARAKRQRRMDKRHIPAAAPEIVSAADVIGDVPSIAHVMRSFQEGPVRRTAAPIPVKLFVGSLSDQTTSAALGEHFAPCGPITEAIVITDRASGASRNFGFVTMADRRDGPRAIEALDGSELDGNRIVVRVATESR
ncbi:MAG: hypothetical protein OXU20_21640 [Myxococcales bacterium]|nr:hypothetical protein [Myxococcales bacterium]MDD9966988.1 hypothetical protein [Myxococcales bacterium]